VDAIWFLKQVDWLGELGEPEWGELRRRASRRGFEPDETIFEPAPDPRSVYLLESGRVRIYRLSADGAEATLGFIAPGEAFGELAAFGDYRRDSFASAQIASVVWKIPVELFREWVRTRPKLVIALTRQIGERMKRVELRVESLVFRNVRSRLALVLLELADDFGHTVDGHLVLEIGLSQGELATLIGTTRQSVSTSIKEMKESGLVRQHRGRIELLDPQRLRELAAR
jgi:CRP/FNR family cyclic AMP-dependent transcriptional regulator